jgi:putative aldouronate transport system permease protein
MKNKTPSNALHRKPKFSAQWELHALMLPAMIVILIFSYFPMYGIILAFKQYNPRLGVFGSDWVGFKHFIRLFEDPFFVRSLRNSVGMSFFRIFLLFPLPIFLPLPVIRCPPLNPVLLRGRFICRPGCTLFRERN